MQEKIKISVIIPVYNSEKYLKRCLDSVLGQTMSELEVICVNDGSTDKSLEILEQYSKSDERIIIINQNNLGVSTARNAGLDIARGEYVGFVDADDFIDSDFYEKLYTNAAVYSADVVCGGIKRENEKKRATLMKYNTVKTVDDVKEKFKSTNTPKYSFVWNKIYLREKLLINGIKFEDGIFYEDLIFTPNVLIKLGRLVTVSDTYYHYWKHSDSVIKIDTDKTRADKLYTKKMFKKILRDNGLEFLNAEALESKADYTFLGIKLFKIYKYRATKKYYLFGCIPFLTVKEYV